MISAAEAYSQEIREAARGDARAVLGEAIEDARRIRSRIDALADASAGLLRDVRREGDRLTAELGFEPELLHVENATSGGGSHAAELVIDAEVEVEDDEPETASPALQDEPEEPKAEAEEPRAEPDQPKEASTPGKDDPGSVPCSACNTTGQCSRCRGKGRRFMFTCSRCNGTGRCSVCGGPGYVWSDPKEG